ncbi:metallophosphoesterase [Actinotalea sp. M2MS4P-6]|uniref:metallophosphoesterase family protein n=1 Tax=Actinotalea sp. M2MS4P-6 TaxID=2983762 RepID=UPI0021E3F81F|nr:metallophosphoesterase [Actinotalea sp. M2MS4P-6]MCV2393954.1 metallophosphoesterase [Actinotalea sp. M2MS4P-6]
MHDDHDGAPSAPVPEVRQARPRRVVVRLLAVVLLVVASVTFGVTTAEAPGTLGPHLARYQMTVDHEVTIDLGPLGTLVIDSPLPFVLGARVTVEEIPAELSALDQSATIAAISGDLQKYLQFFGSPQVTLEAAARALLLDALRRTLTAMVVLVGAWYLLRRLLGPVRRHELAGSARAHQGVIAAGTAAALLVVGTVSASERRASVAVGERHASAVFDGTPLEGARITGRLAGLIDTYGGYALDLYRENEQFYTNAADAVSLAWADQSLRDEADVLLNGPHAPTADTIDALVISDLHCNVGMARVITRVAELAELDLVLNAGDSTIDGTAVESYCVQSFAQAVPDGVGYVVADGNHDSALTSQQEAAAGAVVLSGQVVEVEGLRILGDSDPNETRIGEGTHPVGEESAADESARLADVACEDGDVDLLLIHTPVVGTDALERGCVPAQVSGHLHSRQGPFPFGEGVRYISSSTAGARLYEPTVGPLVGTAEMTILRFDAETHRIRDYRLIQVFPSGEAVVGPALRWPSSPVVMPPLDAPV